MHTESSARFAGRRSIKVVLNFWRPKVGSGMPERKPQCDVRSGMPEPICAIMQMHIHNGPSSPEIYTIEFCVIYTSGALQPSLLAHCVSAGQNLLLCDCAHRAARKRQKLVPAPAAAPVPVPAPRLGLHTLIHSKCIAKRFFMFSLSSLLGSCRSSTPGGFIRDLRTDGCLCGVLIAPSRRGHGVH